MPVSYIKYKLFDGYIDHWLKAGPSYSVLESITYNTNTARQKFSNIKGSHHRNIDYDQMPVEPGLVTDGQLEIDGFLGKWAYYKCDEDHLIITNCETQNFSYLKSWAHTQINVKRDKNLLFELHSSNHIDIWMNKIHVYSLEPTSNKIYRKEQFKAQLSKGNNSIDIRCEDVGSGKHALAFSLRVVEEDGSQIPRGAVNIPSSIQHINRRNELEKAFEEAYLDRIIFNSNSHIEVKWPNNIKNKATYQVRLQTPEGRIYAQSDGKGVSDKTASLGHAASLSEGPYDVLLLPVPREYYEENIRITRKLPIWVSGNHHFSDQTYKSFDIRKQEVLQSVSRHDDTLYSAIAAMALGKWDSIDFKNLQKKIGEIKNLNQYNQKQILALLGAFLRYRDIDNRVISLLKVSLGSIDFYHLDELITLNTQENNQILLPTIGLLISQMHHALEKTQNYEGQLREWMIHKGQHGFEKWDSLELFADVLFALSYIIDLSESDDLFNLAGVLMDKLLFSLAVNTYKGTYGGSRGYSSELDVQGGLKQPTAGISKLFWGMGIFNDEVGVCVSLASMKNYEMPSIIEDIANSQDEIWGTEKHPNIVKSVYRTPNFMLSSTQGNKPGTNGHREHLWQATLGSEAVVFSNHPGACTSLNPDEPSYWSGNGTLPKTTQWKDVLIAIYNLPNENWLDFTHAYFPLYAFDQYKRKDNWYFARKGNGYVAITSSNPIILIKSGKQAYRELRCNGRKTIWVCQLGQAEIDGSFLDFQNKILKLPIQFSDLSLEFTSLRSENLKVSWGSALQLNNLDVEYLKDYAYAYPFARSLYPMESLDVQHNQYLLRLDFNPAVLG